MTTDSFSTETQNTRLRAQCIAPDAFKAHCRAMRDAMFAAEDGNYPYRTPIHAFDGTLFAHVTGTRVQLSPDGLPTHPLLTEHKTMEPKAPTTNTATTPFRNHNFQELKMAKTSLEASLQLLDEEFAHRAQAYPYPCLTRLRRKSDGVNGVLLRGWVQQQYAANVQLAGDFTVVHADGMGSTFESLDHLCAYWELAE